MCYCFKIRVKTVIVLCDDSITGIIDACRHMCTDTVQSVLTIGTLQLATLECIFKTLFVDHF